MCHFSWEGKFLFSDQFFARQSSTSNRKYSVLVAIITEISQYRWKEIDLHFFFSWIWRVNITRDWKGTACLFRKNYKTWNQTENFTSSLALSTCITTQRSIKGKLKLMNRMLDQNMLSIKQAHGPHRSHKQRC